MMDDDEGCKGGIGDEAGRRVGPMPLPRAHHAQSRFLSEVLIGKTAGKGLAEHDMVNRVKTKCGFADGLGLIQ